MQMMSNQMLQCEHSLKDQAPFSWEIQANGKTQRELNNLMC